MFVISELSRSLIRGSRKIEASSGVVGDAAVLVELTVSDWAVDVRIVVALVAELVVGFTGIGFPSWFSD